MAHTGMNITKTAVILCTGIICICFTTFVMCVGAIGLMVGASTSWWMAPLSFALSVAVTWLAAKRPPAGTILIAAALALSAIVISIVISAWFVDFSYDGNMHHKQAVAFLNEGWNPLRMPISEWPHFQELYPDGSNTEPWIDHYPRGLWLYGAIIYDLTGSIEAGKSYALVSMSGCLCVFTSLARQQGLTVWQSIILGALASANPITIAQMSTYSNDAFLMMVIFTLLASLFALTKNDSIEGPSSSFLWKLLFASSFIASAQTKFTGLAYAGIFSVAFLGVYLFLFSKDPQPRALRRFIHMGLLMLVVLIASVAVIGYGPYMTNWVNAGNPLFPLAGEGSVDIMTNNTPEALRGKGTLEKEFDALFATAANPAIGDDYELQLKLPFSMTLSELAQLRANDLRLSGFGVLNSGMAILCLIGTIPMLAISRKRWPAFFASCIAYYACTVLLAIALGDGWWARYSAYRYLAYLMLLGFIFRCWNTGAGRVRPIAMQAAGVLLILLLSINSILFAIVNTGASIARSLLFHVQAQEVASRIGEGEALHVVGEGYLIGALFDLEDAGIPTVFDGASETAPDQTEVKMLHLYCWVGENAE